MITKQNNIAPTGSIRMQLPIILLPLCLLFSSLHAASSEDLFLKFGTPAPLQSEVDLRQAYFKYRLYPKKQGMRPSCSVFAIVGALELQHAQNTGNAEKLSEDYLIWATRKNLGIPQSAAKNYDPKRDGDLGFSLIDVSQALQNYGILTQSEMPNTFGKAMAKISEPSDALIQQAKTRGKIQPIYINGRNNEVRIANIIHTLNAGIPVVIGLHWPNNKTLRNAPRLSKQKPIPGNAHAVTLVGYRDKTGNIEDTIFLFRNSWGNQWGMNGHGWITYEYLEKNLQSAVFLQ